MRILRLELINFRSHTNTTIEFTNGVNIILGRNGSGKSSIQHAIGVALFNSKHIPLKNLVTHGAESSTIIVKFKLDKIYTISRTFGKSSGTTLANEDGLAVANGNECYDYIKKLMGISVPLDTFYQNIIGVNQFNMTSLFMLNASTRKQLINEILGISKYKKAWTNLREIERHFEDEVKELEFAIERLKISMDSYKGIEEKIKRAEKEIKKAEKELNKITTKLQEANLLDAEYERIRKAAEKSRKNYDEILDLEQALSKLAVKLEDVKKAKIKLDLLLKKQEQRQKLIDLKNREHAAFTATKNHIDAQRKKAASQIEMLKDASYCPLCGTPLEESHRDQVIEELEKALAVLQPPKWREPKIPESVAQQIADLEYEVNRESLYEEKINTISKQLDLLYVDVDFEDYDEEAHQEIKQQIEHYMQSQLDYQVELRTNRKYIEDSKERLNKLKALKRELGEHTNRLGLLMARRDFITEVRDIVKNIEPIISNNIRTNVQKKAANLIADLLDNVGLTIDDEYLVYLIINGNDIPYPSLSGGQQILAAVAVRQSIAISANVDFVILDEPTDALDEISKESLLALMTRQSVRQTIIITHDDAIDSCDNKIEFQLLDGVSRYK